MITAFYWDCMKPNGGGRPTGKLATLIDRDFGSYDKFRTEFVNAGMTAFGSGWAWLVYSDGKLKVLIHFLHCTILYQYPLHNKIFN